MHNSMQTNDPSAQILQKRKIRDGTDVSAWRTPCVKRALPESLSNNGGRTRKGWQTDTQESARTRRPSLALPQRRRNERVRHQKMNLLMCLCVSGLSKPTDNVGQQAKDNWQILGCQCSLKKWSYSTMKRNENCTSFIFILSNLQSICFEQQWIAVKNKVT